MAKAAVCNSLPVLIVCKSLKHILKDETFPDFLGCSLWTDFYVKDLENPTDVKFMRAPKCLSSLQVRYSANSVQH